MRRLAQIVIKNPMRCKRCGNTANGQPDHNRPDNIHFLGMHKRATEFRNRGIEQVSTNRDMRFNPE